MQTFGENVVLIYEEGKIVGFIDKDAKIYSCKPMKTVDSTNITRATYLNITTNETTVVKSGDGVFYGFTINNIGFTTAGTITVYDNTAGSGTLIGTWTIPIHATKFFPPVWLNASFATGLTIVTATTAPACNITVLFR